MYRLVTAHSVTDRQTDKQYSSMSDANSRSDKTCLENEREIH